MDHLELIRSLKSKNDSKIVLLVADGLGGLPMQAGGPTELEAAKTPNLDALARRGSMGLSIPICPGITPGSGPGHLGLFGYDPLKYQIGRGVLEATGIGFAVGPDDVAIRGNFCTLGKDGTITDRRAGRIPSEESAAVVKKLRQIRLPEAEVFVEPVKEHRFVLVLRSEGLGGNVADTDPQKTGVPPLDPEGDDPASERTAQLAKAFFDQACEILANEPKANGLTLRGFSKMPDLPRFEDVYGVRPAAIAVYPMYKGLASLVGMEIVGNPETLDQEIDVLEKEWKNFDFFFVHFKYTDSRGEDGNFDAKRQATETFDAILPRVTALGPTVLVVTGDHSTPSALASHSWHPVPTMIVADHCRTQPCQKFGETECLHGALGQFEAIHLMPLALAHAGRLGKFGA